MIPYVLIQCPSRQDLLTSVGEEAAIGAHGLNGRIPSRLENQRQAGDEQKGESKLDAGAQTPAKIGVSSAILHTQSRRYLGPKKPCSCPPRHIFREVQVEADESLSPVDYALRRDDIVE